MVVPYNPLLLKNYKSHINVKVTNSLAIIKYLNKYISKGHDCADVGLKNKFSEAKRYKNARYLSSIKAM